MSVGWKRGFALAATGLWIWFIFARSAQSAAESSAESAVFWNILRRFLPFISHTAIRKLAHFTEYAVLGGLLFRDWRLLGRGAVLLPIGLGAAVAAVDELMIQTHTPGRSGELRDALLDTAGVAAAVGIGLLLRRRKERHSHGKSGKET